MHTQYSIDRCTIVRIRLGSPVATSAIAIVVVVDFAWYFAWYTASHFVFAKKANSRKRCATSGTFLLLRLLLLFLLCRRNHRHFCLDWGFTSLWLPLWFPYVGWLRRFGIVTVDALLTVLALALGCEKLADGQFVVGRDLMRVVASVAKIAQSLHKVTTEGFSERRRRWTFFIFVFARDWNLVAVVFLHFVTPVLD